MKLPELEIKESWYKRSKPVLCLVEFVKAEDSIYDETETITQCYAVCEYWHFLNSNKKEWLPVEDHLQAMCSLDSYITPREKFKVLKWQHINF